MDMTATKKLIALKFGGVWRHAALCLSSALAVSCFPSASNAAAGFYAGVFAGAADARNQIVDVDGFSKWGEPGFAVGYDDPGFAGGVLVGKKLDGLPVRIEIDAGSADLSAATKGLDPVVGDETAASKLRWFAAARAGVERALGPATIFVAAGLAAAQIESSLTDLDRVVVDGVPTPWRMDPDDSFRDRSIKIGWVAGIGVETALAGAWTLRLEGSYMNFGGSTHTLNHSANNRCGPEGERRACTYRVENSLGLLRLAIIRKFAL